MTTLLLMLFVSVPIECFGELTLTLSENGQATTNELIFEQSPRVRSISLSPGLTYKVSCGISNDGSFLDDPWTKDSSALSEMAIDDASGPTPQAFFENTHTNTKDLYLYNFDSSLVGNYTCLSTEDIKSLIITASNPSVVLSDTHYERTVDANAQLTIIYSVFGDPVPEVETNPWYFEGSPIDTPAAFGLQIAKLSPTFIIRFTNGAQKTHSGEYTIVVSSSAGTSNDSFTLQVFSTPIISISSNCNCLADGQISVSMNSSFTISCTDTNSNPLPVFTWFKDGIEDPEDLLVPDSHIAIEKVSSTESRLAFTDTDLSHAGVYSCKANNTKQKDLKSVTVNVEYAPQVSVISPLSIDVPVGEDIVILVEYQGGYPAPTANWTHLNGTTPLSQNGRAFQSGEYYLNLTVIESTVQDEGQYVLRVDNGVDTAVTLEFTVNILAPPTLIYYSNTTTFRQVGSTALFIVGVVSAQPPVNLSDLSWSGNFDPSRQTVTFEDGEVVLELSDLQVSDTGNITLTVKHAAGNVDISFELIVLNVPVVPDSIEILSYGTCHVQVRWVITDPAPSTAPVDEVLLEQKNCYHNDTDCDKEWDVLNTYPSDIQSCNISLLPNEDYSFRLTSCNDLFGCSDPEVVPIRVESHLQDFIPRVSLFSVNTVNVSAVKVVWSDTREMTDCYNTDGYEVSCRSVSRNVEVFSTTIRAHRRATTYNIFVTGLEPDTQYNCTVFVVYRDLLGGVVHTDAPPSFGVNNTNARMPEIQEDFDVGIDINTDIEGTVSIDLDNLPKLFDTGDISYVHVGVLRLGNFPTLPPGTPDERYPHISDFSTYEMVHSPGNSDNKPYIAGEINADDDITEFLLGSGDHSSGRKREEYINGPLDTSAYYTVFIRAYANSKFGRQSTVFVSSSFTGPFKPEESDSEATDASMSSSGTGTIIASVVVVLVVVLVAVVAVIVVLGIYAYKRNPEKIKMTESAAYSVTSAAKKAMHEEINLAIAAKNEEGIHVHND